MGTHTRRVGASVCAAVALALPAGASLADAAPAPAAASTAATIVVSNHDQGTISPDLFGANLLWPYGAGGAYDARAGRFYPGFVSAVRSSGVTVLRYPGGTTADSFVWQHAVGPQATRRPNEPFGVQNAGVLLRGTVRDGPVASIVGPNEFASLLQDTHASGSLVVNFATGSAQSAADLVAYLSAPLPATATRDRANPGYWAAQRAANGDPSPAAITYVEVGNEQQIPAEYGWRSGALVSYGPGAPRCPSGAVATCLYVFGGTTRFVDQGVGRPADELPPASLGSGRADQTRFVYYPPVVPDSQTVTVGGVPWRAVASLADAPPGAHVYSFDPASGRIAFGGAGHGAAPPAGAPIAVSYDSGPHDGFNAFYAAIKAMDPAAQVCATEGADPAFFSLMGRTHPYDCVEMHEYASPRAVNLPLRSYEDALMAYPGREARQIAMVKAEIRAAAGRAVPIVLTEYGQSVRPMPTADQSFLLSLDEGLLVANQLRTWIRARLPLAEKYLLTSSPFLPTRSLLGTGSAVVSHVRGTSALAAFTPGRNIASAMIASAGARFLTEPSGLVLQLFSTLGGDHLLATTTRGGAQLPLSGAPVLQSVAARSPSGPVLLVINDSPDAAAAAAIDLGAVAHGTHLTVSVLDGASASAYNTVPDPRAVRVTTRSLERSGASFDWRFPAHSVTLISWS